MAVYREEEHKCVVPAWDLEQVLHKGYKGTSFPGLTIRWEKIWQNLLQKEAVAMGGEKKITHMRKTEPQSYVSLVIMFWQYVVADETKSGNEWEGIPSKNVLD